MKVKELIEQLKTHNQDAIVVTQTDRDGSYEEAQFTRTALFDGLLCKTEKEWKKSRIKIDAKFLHDAVIIEN